jgi:hypothetical protein
MCYEFSSWYWKARAKELHRAREQPGDAKRAPAEAAPRAPERAPETVKEPEKMPA